MACADQPPDQRLCQVRFLFPPADATAVEVFKPERYFISVFKPLRALHQTCAVESSGEYRLRETASEPPGPEASAQPLPHNPRKQRKNPAAAGSGERFREGKWRRLRDSNPGDAFTPAGFQDRCNRPLCQTSVARVIRPRRRSGKPHHDADIRRPAPHGRLPKGLSGR